MQILNKVAIVWKGYFAWRFGWKTSPQVLMPIAHYDELLKNKIEYHILEVNLRGAERQVEDINVQRMKVQDRLRESEEGWAATRDKLKIAQMISEERQKNFEDEYKLRVDLQKKIEALITQINTKIYQNQKLAKQLKELKESKRAATLQTTLRKAIADAAAALNENYPVEVKVTQEPIQLRDLQFKVIGEKKPKLTRPKPTIKKKSLSVNKGK